MALQLKKVLFVVGFIALGVAALYFRVWYLRLLLIAVGFFGLGNFLYPKNRVGESLDEN